MQATDAMLEKAADALEKAAVGMALRLRRVESRKLAEIVINAIDDPSEERCMEMKMGAIGVSIDNDADMDD